MKRAAGAGGGEASLFFAGIKNGRRDFGVVALRRHPGVAVSMKRPQARKKRK